MKLKRLLYLLLLVQVFAFGQNTLGAPFNATGLTQTITAKTSGNIPTPVQVTGVYNLSQQYLLSNIGLNVAFVSVEATSALATTTCVIPTGTGQNVYILLPSTQIIVTDIPNAYFCSITSSSTSVLYITPGLGY